jgi:hypothetical protein
LPRTQHVLRLLGDLGGLATQAGAISGSFGGLRRSEELDGVAARPSAGAGGPAIDAGRPHSKDKVPVLPSIPVHNLLPLNVNLHGLHTATLLPVAKADYPAIAAKAKIPFSAETV